MNGPDWMDEDESRAAAGAETGVRAGRAPELSPYLVPEPEDVETLALERELRAALRPFEVPVGFADRVLAARDAAGGRRPEVKAKVLPFRSALRSWRVAAGGAIAATVLAGSLLVDQIHERREQARSQATEQQLETAVQVSNHALDEARAQLARAAFRLNQ